MDILQTIFLALIDNYTESEEVQKEEKGVDKLLGNEKLDKEQIFDLDDKIANYSAKVKQEYFILGFKTAFSLLKDVNK